MDSKDLFPNSLFLSPHLVFFSEGEDNWNELGKRSKEAYKVTALCERDS